MYLPVLLRRLVGDLFEHLGEMGEVIIPHLGGDDADRKARIFQKLLSLPHLFHHDIILEGLSGLLLEEPGEIFLIQVNITCHICSGNVLAEILLDIGNCQCHRILVSRFLLILCIFPENAFLSFRIAGGPL